MQLQFKDLVKLFDELKEKYSIEEIMEMPIYIGDDYGFNKIYSAFFVDDFTDDEFLVSF